MSRLIDDVSYQNAQAQADRSRLNYIITNYADMVNGTTKIYPGIPPENTDVDSTFRNGVYTKCREFRDSFSTQYYPNTPPTVNRVAEFAKVDRVHHKAIENYTDHIFAIFSDSVPPIDMTRAVQDIDTISTRFD